MISRICAHSSTTVSALKKVVKNDLERGHYLMVAYLPFCVGTIRSMEANR